MLGSSDEPTSSLPAQAHAQAAWSQDIPPPTNQLPSHLFSHPLVSHAELSGGRGSFLLVLHHAKRSERFARCYSKRQNLTKCFVFFVLFSFYLPRTHTCSLQQCLCLQGTLQVASRRRGERRDSESTTIDSPG